MMKFLASKFLVTACSSALLISGPALAQNRAPIKIGVPTALTGPYAQLGLEMKGGLEYAVAEVNAKGGVNGRRVQLEAANTESNPDVARRAAERLVQNGYRILVGTVASSEAMAISSQVEKWDAIYYSTINKLDKLTGDGCNRRTFRGNHSDAMDMMVVTPWLKARPEKEWVILGADYAWGRDSGAAFTKAVEATGGKVKLALYAPLGTKDYAPYIQQLKAQNAQGMWLAISGRDAINFGLQASQFGLMKGILSVGQTFAVPATIKGMGDVAEGVHGVVNYATNIDTPQNKAFISAFKKSHDGRDPTNYEAEAYLGVQVLFAAIAKAGDDEPRNVARALEGLTVDNTIFGKVTMRAKDHQLVRPNYFGKIAKVDGELKPVIEVTVNAAESMPPPSPLCKME